MFSSIPFRRASRGARAAADMALLAPRGAAPRSPRGWRWWLPGIVLVLFLASAIGFLRFSQKYEAGQRQDQQIADTLWVEQSIRFQMGRDEEALQILARDIGEGKISRAALDARISHLLRTSREIARIGWFDANGKVLVASGAGTVGSAAGPNAGFDGDATLADGLERTRHAGSLFYGPHHAEAANGATLMDAFIPVQGGGPRGSALVATYALTTLLDEMVPWWFAQDNEVQLLDADGTVLAARIAAGHGRNVYTHTTALDLSGTALYLRTDSLRGAPGLLPNMLAGGVLLLSLTLLWSLWALWRDVRRRNEAELQLRDQHAFRKAMEDSLVTGLRARDLDGRVTYVNPAFCKMVGYAPDDLLGHVPPMPYWVPDAIETHQRNFSQIMAGEVPRHGYESVFQHRNGERIQVLIYEAPLIDARGRHTGWMSSVLDVTERRRMEELTRQQQEKLMNGARLATMGEIASTLSHELNQPLAAITSYATGSLNLIDAAARQTTPTEGDGFSPDSPQRRDELRDALGKILGQAQRAGRIIRSVHDLLKKREPRRTPCSLADLIAATQPLIELQARKSGVRVRARLPERSVTVSGDRIMLEQVLLNLTRNAIEAMHDTPAAQRHLDIRVETGDDKVTISVADRGAGIAEAVRAQLFAPFFSTKDEGMGMGLSICRSAIEFHGGHIEHRPNPGGGSVFLFTLPIVADVAVADSSGGTAPPT